MNVWNACQKDERMIGWEEWKDKRLDEYVNIKREKKDKKQ